ncbi:S-type pyocin domain-containing protein [Pseudomonas plecoglossicida]|uniref:S-type pyocin domain-containing protein n=1 Tax=Pseudomonas plecoglossicida TaxID=70775 RepID=UPI003977C0F6
MSQGPTELPNSYVDSTRLPVGPHLWGTHPGASFQLVSVFEPGRLDIDLIVQTENDKAGVHKAHEQRLATLQQDLDQAIRDQAGSLDGLGEVQANERTIAAVNELQALFAARLQATRDQAYSFFGGDPVNRNLHEFLAVARKPNAPADPQQAWLDAYRAAFDVKYLEQVTGELAQRQQQLQSTLSALRAREGHDQDIDRTLQQYHQALAQLGTASQAFLQASSTLQAMLTAFGRHPQESIAPPAALEHSRELERETSDLLKARGQLAVSYAGVQRGRDHLAAQAVWIDTAIQYSAPGASEGLRATLFDVQAQLQAQVAAYTQSSTTDAAALMQLLAQADHTAASAFDEQTSLAALSGQTPGNTPVTFNAWVASIHHPLILATSRGGMAHFEPVWVDFAEALGKAAQRLLTGGVLAVARYVPLMLYSARLGDGERMGVTVPLALMSPGADLTLEANRKAGQTLELPLRMDAVPQGTQTEVYLAATDGSGILRDVRVRQAQWDAAQGAYRFTAEGLGSATLLWHPATPPSTLSVTGENGTVIPGSPIVEDLQKHLPGPIIVPPEPDIRTFPELPDLQIDDYVIIFPADSGLAPIYVMLRSPRNLPGVASGNGVVTPDKVLDAAATAAGSPIPTRIAERLRGRRFARFDKLKEAIWMEIAADVVFSRHIMPAILDDMRKGLAPFAKRDQRVGKRVKLEIHHKHEIAQGGAVYDLDNLVFMTPQVHINHHRGRNQ